MTQTVTTVRAAGTETRQPTVGDGDRLRREELAAFLRSRRERISPEQMGLPTYGRRRTPGLRREEVAQLAGVGVTWYTWLEQGRDINVSVQVLDAIARSLLLDPQERQHLFTLAGSPLTEIGSECHAVPAAVHLLLEGLVPYPALVTNARKDVLAFNVMFEAISGSFDGVPLDERNMLWQIFTNPRWRRTMLDWDVAAPRLVAQYRGAMAEHVGEPAWKCLVQRLQAVSPEFAAIWERHDVEGSENRTKRILHEDVGLLRLDYTYLWLGQRTGVRLTTYTPSDDDTSQRLTLLHRHLTSAGADEAVARVG